MHLLFHDHEEARPKERWMVALCRRRFT